MLKSTVRNEKHGDARKRKKVKKKIKTEGDG